MAYGWQAAYSWQGPQELVRVLSHQKGELAWAIPFMNWPCAVILMWLYPEPEPIRGIIHITTRIYWGILSRI